MLWGDYGYSLLTFIIRTGKHEEQTTAVNIKESKANKKGEKQE